MLVKTQLIVSLFLIALVFLALIPTLPYNRVMKVTSLLRAHLEFSPMEDIFVPPYKDPLQQAISRQKVEVYDRQRNCTTAGLDNLSLPDLSLYDDTLLTTDYTTLMFFLLTSTRPTLTIRQVCAVESGVRYSGRTVVLAITSDTLDICSNKIIPILAMPNLLLVKVNTSLLVKNTPLQKVWDDGRVARSCCSIIHTSDMLRMAVLYR